MKNGGIRKIEEKFRTQRNNIYGYPTVLLTDSRINIYKLCSVHRLVAKAFIENSFNKETVNHKNGIKNDNNVSNLEWMTPLENIKHAFKNGLVKPRGKKIIYETNSV